jgi:DNA recombination protein RmuC
MDLDLNQTALIVIAIAVFGGLLAGWLIGAQRSGRAAEEAARQSAELQGRLNQLAETLTSTQSQITDRLQGQERTIGQLVEQRLSSFGERVGKSLNEQGLRQNETLSKLGERLAVIDNAQQNITKLSQEVVSLQDILSNKQARGAFGEVQLRDLVSAILPPSVYSFQTTLSTGVRVDCLLKLPNPPGSIGIDAKFPLESYERLRQAREESERLLAARAFRADVKKHVADIAAKYVIPGETAESALLFLPSEAVYAELHANFREVVEESYKARVWIVSPTTLMATLNTVRAVLKDVRMREQAHVIQKYVGLLRRDVELLDERVDKLSKHFDQAQGDIKGIKTSSGRIAERSNKIAELELEDETEAAPSLTPPTSVGSGS